MEQLGMVGVGAMGSSLLGRLRLGGLSVAVFDCDPAAQEKAISMGAKGASSAAAVADASSIIDVVVRTNEEMFDCMLGEKGVLEGAGKGTLVLLHSTILPTTTKKIAEEAQKKGVDVIDACMVGVPRVVQKGEVNFLVGGPVELVERARPHLLKMGKAVIHMGPLGAGNAAKLIKNLVTGSETLILHEAIKIGEACGIKYCDALKMMKQVSSPDNLIDHWEERFDPSGADSTPKVGVNLYDKDLPLAGQVGREYGVDIPITEQLVAAGLRLMAGRSKAS
ncbi:MAG: NAD-binding protein [Deltaproteobacteria bacterium]|nr:NAD-binding protein [Deltaproteobacteria bacterium]